MMILRLGIKFLVLTLTQRFQSKILRLITCAPWYVPNEVIQREIHGTIVKDEIANSSEKYKKRLFVHPNNLTVGLLNTARDVRRLKRYYTSDLPTRFRITRV